MDIVIIALRLIHILSGVFWAGTAFFFVSFLEPAVKATGPEGGKVMQRLSQMGYSTALSIVGVLNVGSGLLMYVRDFGLTIQLTTGAGLGFTFGGAAGLLALLVGLFVARPAAARVGVLGKQIQASGKPPTPEQLAEIQALQRRLGQGALWTALLLALALIGMSTARYLSL